MKKYLHDSACIVLLISLLSSCINYRKPITDEVVMKDGNSQTGTIITCDSANLKLKKIDESISRIPWSAVDTVQGKKLRTFWLGANFGYYNTPYFSVFRNEAITGQSFGMQYKIGMAYRGTKLYYLNLSYMPAAPYSITKSGFGFQRYLGGRTYLKDNCFFVGSEFNFMNAKYNNGAQTTVEPFTGYEKKLNERLRIHFKFGVQFNISNKNNQTGFNATIGIHFLKKNFKKNYEILNKEHRMYRK